MILRRARSRAVNHVVAFDEFDDRAIAGGRLGRPLDDERHHLVEIGDRREHFLLRGHDRRQTPSQLNR